MNGSILVPPGLQISCFGDIAEVGAKNPVKHLIPKKIPNPESCHVGFHILVWCKDDLFHQGC